MSGYPLPLEVGVGVIITSPSPLPPGAGSLQRYTVRFFLQKTENRKQKTENRKFGLGQALNEDHHHAQGQG